MLSFLRHTPKALGFCVATLFSMSQVAHADVTLNADLGADIIHTDERGRVYLRLSLSALTNAHSEKRTPVNVALVLDRSGSMKGERLAAAKQAAKMALNRLSNDDFVSVVAYNHGVQTVQSAGRLVEYEQLKRRIDQLQADGRTALYAGVVEGGRQVREFISNEKVSRVILLSDGLANVGPSRPDELASLGQKFGSEGISVTTIGLGLQYNEDLMSKLALASDGNHAFAEKPDDLARIFASEFGDVLSVVATDVIINIECRTGFTPKRVLGRNAKIDGNRIQLRLNQLYGGQEKYVIVELSAPASRSVGLADIADVKVDYLDLKTKTRAAVDRQVRTKFTNDSKSATASINKGVMTQVTTQIATERNEKAVSLRDKGDIKGARALLQDNAVYLQKKAKEYGASALTELEQTNRAQAGQLDEKNWAKTRKSMRYNQHRSKVQQAY